MSYVVLQMSLDCCKCSGWELESLGNIVYVIIGSRATAQGHLHISEYLGIALVTSLRLLIHLQLSSSTEQIQANVSYLPTNLGRHVGRYLVGSDSIE